MGKISFFSLSPRNLGRKKYKSIIGVSIATVVIEKVQIVPKLV
jgi:hypothetical protein